MNVTPPSRSGTVVPRPISGTWHVPRSPIGAVLLVSALSLGPDDEPRDPIGEAISEAGFATLTVDPHGLAGDGAPPGNGGAGDGRASPSAGGVEAIGHAVAGAADWLAQQPVARGRPIGVVGWGHDASAALWAAVEASGAVGAVVCQADSSEAAARALPAVRTPTLLALESAAWDDTGAARMALDQMKAPHRMVVMPTAADPSAAQAELPVVGRFAARWFTEHLAGGLR